MPDSQPIFQETVMNNLTTVLTASVATALLSIARLAQADMINDAPKQMLVHFADLDLSKPAGITALYGRLEGAAKRVCAPLAARIIQGASDYRHCVKDAISRSVTEVNQPDLSAYYRAKVEGRNGTPPRIVAQK
jgi:UrcA family protein